MPLCPPAFRPPTSKTSKTGKTMATRLRAVARRVQTVTRRLLCLDRPRLVADQPAPETAVDPRSALYASNVAIRSLVFGDSFESVDPELETTQTAEIQPDQKANKVDEQSECQEPIRTAASCTSLIVWSPPLSAVYGPKEQGVIERLDVPQQMIMLARRPYMALIQYSAKRFPWEVVGDATKPEAQNAQVIVAEHVTVCSEGMELQVAQPEAFPTEAVAQSSGSDAKDDLIKESASIIESDDTPYAAIEAPDSPIIEPRSAVAITATSEQEARELAEAERRRRVAIWLLLFA